MSDCEVIVQIKKINNDKLKVILSSNDLDEKNIDIDSFLANSIESQDLFFEILDLAEEQYDFNIENNKAIVEAITLDNNIFILTITKLKSELKNSYNSSSKIYFFESIDDIFSIYNILNENNINLDNTYIYEFFNKYYLLSSNISDNIENILLEYSSPINNPLFFESILVEHAKRIK